MNIKLKWAEAGKEVGRPVFLLWVFPSGLVELNFNCIRGHKRAGTAPGSLRVPVCTPVFVNISSGAVHFFNCSHCYKAHDSKGRLTGQKGVTWSGEHNTIMPVPTWPRDWSRAPSVDSPSVLMARLSKSPLIFFQLVMQATRDYGITGVIEACLLFRFDPLPLVSFTIVIRGDWLWKAANINDKNNSAAVYVGSTLKVHNPLFSVGKLLRNKLMQRF